MNENADVIVQFPVELIVECEDSGSLGMLKHQSLNKEEMAQNEGRGKGEETLY